MVIEPTDIMPMTTTPAPTTDGTNEQNSSNHLPEPQYIDQTKYEGDELGIVITLNRYIKALYENDKDSFNEVRYKPTDIISPPFPKYILRIDKLDFNVEPYPSEIDDYKAVLITYKIKWSEDYKDNSEDDEQLFLFRPDEGEWKLDAITWQF